MDVSDFPKKMIVNCYWKSLIQKFCKIEREREREQSKRDISPVLSLRVLPILAEKMSSGNSSSSSGDLNLSKQFQNFKYILEITINKQRFEREILPEIITGIFFSCNPLQLFFFSFFFWCFIFGQAISNFQFYFINRHHKCFLFACFIIFLWFTKCFVLTNLLIAQHCLLFTVFFAEENKSSIFSQMASN